MLPPVAPRELYTFRPQSSLSRYAIRSESVDSQSLPTHRETTQVVGTGPLKPTEETLRQNSYNSSNFPGQQEQFALFQNQSPEVQQKTIETYAANLQQQQSRQIQHQQIAFGQAPPTIPSLHNSEGMAAVPPSLMRGPGGPNATQQASSGNHALADYQMQMMLLEQQNKERLMTARQEQDGGSGTHTLQDYQMQLMLLEQQNKERLMKARQEQDYGNSMLSPPRRGTWPTPPSDLGRDPEDPRAGDLRDPVDPPDPRDPRKHIHPSQQSE